MSNTNTRKPTITITSSTVIEGTDDDDCVGGEGDVATSLASMIVKMVNMKMLLASMTMKWWSGHSHEDDAGPDDDDGAAGNDGDNDEDGDGDNDEDGDGDGG